MNALTVGDKVRCFAPVGWGGHQGGLMSQVYYRGEGLGEDGMPIHGTWYCIRGFDSSCSPFGVYLVGITGGTRLDGTEMSFSSKGFLTPAQYAQATLGDWPT